MGLWSKWLPRPGLRFIYRASEDWNSIGLGESGVDAEELREARARYSLERPYYEQFGVPLQSLIENFCRDEEIPIESITSRAKEVDSLCEKINRRDYTTLD